MLIGLISCTKAKTDYPAPAGELYRPSALFRGALGILSGRADIIYLLSARHGLLSLDQVIAPDDQTLLDMSQAQRATWARGVLDALTARHGASLRGITCEFHAGTAYRFPLESLLRAADADCTCPVAGMPIGERLAFYSHRQAPDRAGAARAEAAVARQTGPVLTAAPATTDLRRLCVSLKGQTLTTGTGAPFRVASVDLDRVTVIPASTGKPRPIPSRELEDAYQFLLRYRTMTLNDVRTEASAVNPAYVFGILAKLTGARVPFDRPLRLMLDPEPGTR